MSALRIAGAVNPTAASERLLALGRELLAEAPVLNGGSAARERLAADLRELERGLSRLDGRLVMGLLGGTGVGKSTFISALAGAPISPAGIIRPTTSRPVIYRHLSFPAPAAFPEVIHEADRLKHLAIIDFPDFDSVETAGRETVLEHLKDLDLLVWLTDPEKYADRALYDFLARTRGFASSSQVVLLNKADALADRPGAAEEILADLDQRLRTYGFWSGRPPRAVSALAARREPHRPEAGGLAPFRALLAELESAKVRRAVEMENLAATSAELLRKLREAAAPEQWRQQLDELAALARSAQLQPAIQAEGAFLSAGRDSVIAPVLGDLQGGAGGLLALLTDLWDFIIRRRRLQPSPVPVPPETSLPVFARRLAGCRADLSALAAHLEPLTEDALSAAGRRIFARILEENFQKRPRPGSAPLWAWPAVLAFLLVWAEAAGHYGLSNLTSAFLRTLAPWIIFSALGDLFISRFIWRRVRLRLERQYQKAQDQFQEALRLELAEPLFFQPLKEAEDARRRALASLSELEKTARESYAAP